MKKIYLISVLFILFMLSGCSNSVDFGEQYKKVLYIMNSKEKLYYAPHLPGAASEGHITVYCGGSEMPDRDYHVHYDINIAALDAFNKNEYGNSTDRYFVALPQDRVVYEREDILIRKGEEYGSLYFKINTVGLDPARVYVIPLSIEKSGDYEINPEMNLIYYVLRIENGYSGDYTSEYTLSGVTRRTQKRLQSLSASQMLVPIAVDPNDEDTVEGHYLLTIHEDNTLSMTPYLQAYIEQDETQESTYNPETKTFMVYYRIKNSLGQIVNVRESMVKI